jgi:endoglucanase
VTLAAGRHVVRLSSVGANGPNLDALTVAPAPAPVEPVTLQAEAAALSGATVRAGNGGFTGTGYADYHNASGDYVEFAYEAPVAGDYLLEFRYANGAAERPLRLSVNGAAGPDVAFAPTGGWSNWRVATATASLAAGANRVRLTAIGSSGPNLDALTVRATPGQAAVASDISTIGAYEA